LAAHPVEHCVQVFEVVSRRYPEIQALQTLALLQREQPAKLQETQALLTKELPAVQEEQVTTKVVVVPDVLEVAVQAEQPEILVLQAVQD